MKVKISIVFLFLSAFLFQACEKMKLQDYFLEPKADMQLSEDKVFVFKTLTITNESEGQQFILYTGARGSEYDSLGTSGAIGFQPNFGKKNFTFSYVEPGKYKVSLLSSGYKSNEKTTVTNVIQKEVIVTDTAKTIEGIVFEKMYGILRNDRNFIATYKEFSPEATIRGKYLTLEMFSPWNPNVMTPTYKPLGNPIKTKFVPMFNLNSNYQNIAIEGLTTNIVNATNGTAKVDFSDAVNMYVPKLISIHPYEGEPKEYTFCILQIPEFKSISIGGISGTLTYDLENSHRFFFDVAAPAGTVFSSMVVKYVTYQTGIKVSLNGIPVNTGDAIKLVVDPKNSKLYSATLDLNFEQPGYESIFNIHSQVVVSVTKTP